MVTASKLATRKLVNVNVLQFGVSWLTSQPILEKFVLFSLVAPSAFNNIIHDHVPSLNLQNITGQSRKLVHTENGGSILQGSSVMMGDTGHGVTDDLRLNCNLRNLAMESKLRLVFLKVRHPSSYAQMLSVLVSIYNGDQLSLPCLATVYMYTCIQPFFSRL